MAKFSIKRNPTFVAPVELPVAGSKPVTVNFTFNYKDRDQLNKFDVDRFKFFDDLGKKVGEGEVNPEDSSARVVEYEFSQLKEIVSGWDMEEEFNDENLRHFVNSSGSMVNATIKAYLASYQSAKEGN